jgi:hypothetical protein
MQIRKRKCKCRNCGQPYTLFVWENKINEFTFIEYFGIVDKANPSKNKVGVAVSHC